MNVAWDEPKRLANLVKHGLNFADVHPNVFRTGVRHAPQHSWRRRILALGQRSCLDHQSASGKQQGKGPDMTKNPGYTDEDLAAVSDNPEWTAEDFANSLPFHVRFPELAVSLADGGPARSDASFSCRSASSGI